MTAEKRLINVNDALAKLCEYCSCGCYEECDYRCSEFDNISNIPTVDAVEVVHGRLIETGWDEEFANYGTCSICGADNRMINNYCVNCGAKMDK